jgi:hypothetical protein
MLGGQLTERRLTGVRTLSVFVLAMLSLLVVLRKKGEEVAIDKCVSFCRRTEYLPWWIVVLELRAGTAHLCSDVASFKSPSSRPELLFDMLGLSVSST